jgi:hypothetical protein
MSLSLAKLENLLVSKGFVVINYFELDEACFYIELFAVKTADTFLMYIPSKYTFPITNGINSFKIKYLDIDNDKEFKLNNSDSINLIKKMGNHCI